MRSVQAMSNGWGKGLIILLLTRSTRGRRGRSLLSILLARMRGTPGFGKGRVFLIGFWARLTMERACEHLEEFGRFLGSRRGRFRRVN